MQASPAEALMHRMDELPGATLRADPEADSDLELVRRAADGDDSAFESLMLRYQRQVQRTAHRILGNADDAMDTAQEVFMKLHRHLRRLEPGRPLGAWLYRVTVNGCRDLGRRLIRRTDRYVNLDAAEARSATSVFQQAEDRLAASEEWAAIQTALATLPEKERTAIVLRDVEGLDTSEVAEILGISEVTVRSHISRGRVRLRSQLERARASGTPRTEARQGERS